jgi:hypothetical protein
MNDIGWLFLFMSELDHNLMPTTLRCQLESSGHLEEYVEPLTPLTVEQIEAVREFFELIAKWDEEKSSHGN